MDREKYYPPYLYRPKSTKPVTTNADRFRAMSDEEQQRYVRGFWEIEDFADWLKQPVLKDTK